MSKSAEMGVLPPRLVPLSAEQEREAVSLLAELLVAAADKRRPGVSDGGLASAYAGASGSVVAFPEKGRKARKAA